MSKSLPTDRLPSLPHCRSPEGGACALFGQFVRFGVVGLVGVVVDVGIFNLLRLTVLAPEIIHEGPVIAKVISTSIAIVTNWIGNRYWTFGSMRRSHVLREGLEFALVSVGGMGIALLCLHHEISLILTKF